MRSNKCQIYLMREAIVWFMLSVFIFTIPNVQATGAVFTSDLWDDPIKYAYNDNVTLGNRTLFESVLDEIEAITAITFLQVEHIGLLEFGINVADDPDVQGGNASVGKSMHGHVNIGSWNATTIRHELGHVMGFRHEHQRFDRDSFVMINFQNIEAGEKGNFDIKDDHPVYGPYDFESKMDYAQCSKTFCEACNRRCDDCTTVAECRTIEVLPPNTAFQTKIGTFGNYSTLDTLALSFMYSQADWVFVNGSYPFAPGCNPSSQVGSFLKPFCNFDPSVAASVPTAGKVFIQAGTYSSVGTYSRPMTLRAPLGGVTLGD